MLTKSWVTVKISLRLLRRYIFLVTGLLVLPAARGKDLPFHTAEAAENMDYHSFAPILLLKHRITAPFRKLPKNPVLQPSNYGWDAEDVADPFIVNTGDSLLLFYSGNGRNDEKYHIGYAVRAAQGWFWGKRSQIISGSGGVFDRFHQIAPVVIPPALSPGKEWRVYYSGNSLDNELGYQWGLAYQNLAGEWTYLKDTPLMPLDHLSWDFAGQAYGDIVYIPEQQLYRMYYTGFQGPLASIGLLESRDGVNWEKPLDKPVLSILPGVIAPEVIFDGTRYTMYFVQVQMAAPRLQTRISRAESPDGIHWSNITDVLVPSDRWEKNSLMRPHLAYFEGRVQLYYCAGGGSWKIGAAYTIPEFEPEGRWLSPEVGEGAKQLVITFEQPAQTRLRVALIDPVLNQRNELPLDHAVPVRSSVRRATIDLPQTAQSGRFRIELHLQTDDPAHSPVVYALRLQP